MVNTRSICTASRISWIFRPYVFSFDRKRFRASCMVSVDEPCARLRECRSRHAAPTARTRFTPQLRSKVLSSMEMIACRSTGGNSVYGNTTRRSSANDPISLP